MHKIIDKIIDYYWSKYLKPLDPDACHWRHAQHPLLIDNIWQRKDLASVPIAEFMVVVRITDIEVHVIPTTETRTTLQR